MREAREFRIVVFPEALEPTMKTKPFSSRRLHRKAATSELRVPIWMSSVMEKGLARNFLTVKLLPKLETSLRQVQLRR
jgi:hypothetical protein